MLSLGFMMNAFQLLTSVPRWAWPTKKPNCFHKSLIEDWQNVIKKLGFYTGSFVWPTNFEYGLWNLLSSICTCNSCSYLDQRVSQNSQNNEISKENWDQVMLKHNALLNSIHGRQSPSSFKKFLPFYNYIFSFLASIRNFSVSFRSPERDSSRIVRNLCSFLFPFCEEFYLCSDCSKPCNIICTQLWFENVPWQGSVRLERKDAGAHTQRSSNTSKFFQT